jgi:hypothetical protein
MADQAITKVRVSFAFYPSRLNGFRSGFFSALTWLRVFWDYASNLVAIGEQRGFGYAYTFFDGTGFWNHDGLWREQGPS